MQNDAAESAAGFTLAHLSDPHLSTLHQVNWRDLANKRLLGYLSWRRRRRFQHRSEVLQALQRDLLEIRPEHLIITGDLTHIALPEEFLQVRRWLQSMGSPFDVTVVPGNHDAYVDVPWHQGLAHWQPYMNSDDHAGQHNGAGSTGSLFPSLRIRGPVALIGLSSAQASAPFLATGSLGTAQLSQLSELLEKTARQGLFRMVLLHHPPVPGEEKWRKRLTDAQALCEILADYGAELVLHGHSHRYRQSRITGPRHDVPVFGIPSASAIGPGAGRIAAYQLYKIARLGNEWKIDTLLREYSPKQGRFNEQHGQSMRLPLIPIEKRR
jgi:3',5'-cyclic AMP phosphodiesterase CpdA